jgi:hypothetical protein
MDDSDLLRLSGVSGGTVALVLIVYRILKSVIGKKLISNCCGNKMEVGIDVQNSTPHTDVVLEIKNPLKGDEARNHTAQ